MGQDCFEIIKYNIYQTCSILIYKTCPIKAENYILDFTFIRHVHFIKIKHVLFYIHKFHRVVRNLKDMFYI